MSIVEYESDRIKSMDGITVTPGTSFELMKSQDCS